MLPSAGGQGRRPWLRHLGNHPGAVWKDGAWQREVTDFNFANMRRLRDRLVPSRRRRRFRLVVSVLRR